MLNRNDWWEVLRAWWPLLLYWFCCMVAALTILFALFG